MNIGVFCRNDQPDKHGNLPIIFYMDQRKISSGETCKSGSWDNDKSCVKPKFAGSDLINKRIIKKKAALQSIIDAQRTFDINIIRKLFKIYLDNPDILDRVLKPGTESKTGEFFVLIDAILLEYGSVWSDGYKKRFKSIRTKFLEYDSNFSISYLTPEWWRGFAGYCIDVLGNVNNTINTDAKVIGRLVEILQSKGFKFPPNIDEISHRYIEPEIMSIEWDEVEKIANLKLTDPIRATMPDSQTAWLVGAYTGRRWGEIERMSEKNFYQDNKKRWRYRSTAKGLKPIDVPLLPEAIAFLKKINFQIPTIAQQTVNRDIKDIARAAGLTNKVLVTAIKGQKIEEEFVKVCDTIHIHTGRHSYAMRVVDLSAGKPHAEKFVSFMLGHASHATTWKYMNRRDSAHDQMFDELFVKKIKS